MTTIATMEMLILLYRGSYFVAESIALQEFLNLENDRSIEIHDK